jgi:ArsR family transcriptional regulator
MVGMFSEQLFFDVLSDETRRRLLVLLLKQGELCVCELFQALDLAQPKVSRHLGVMREAGLLSLRREGTWVFYQIHPQLPLWAYRILEALGQGMAGSPVCGDDAKRLEGMTNRPARCCG